MKLVCRSGLAAAFVVCLLLSSVHGQSFDAKGWFLEGNRLSEQGSFEQAARAYQESIALNPKSPTAHYNLGRAYAQLKNWQGAAQAFEKTLEIAPDHLDATASLGNAYNRLERWQEAIGQLNIVVHRRQGDAEAHGNLGWAYYNDDSGPRFKLLVVANLARAVDLFQAQNQHEAAKATQQLLDDVKTQFNLNAPVPPAP